MYDYMLEIDKVLAKTIFILWLFQQILSWLFQQLFPILHLLHPKMCKFWPFSSVSAQYYLYKIKLIYQPQHELDSADWGRKGEHNPPTMVCIARLEWKGEHQPHYGLHSEHWGWKGEHHPTINGTVLTGDGKGNPPQQYSADWEWKGEHHSNMDGIVQTGVGRGSTTPTWMA